MAPPLLLLLPVTRRSRNYVILSDQSMYIDQQPLKLQESPEVSEGRRTSFTHRLPHEYHHNHHLTTYAATTCRTTAHHSHLHPTTHAFHARTGPLLTHLLAPVGITSQSVLEVPPC